VLDPPIVTEAFSTELGAEKNGFNEVFQVKVGDPLVTRRDLPVGDGEAEERVTV
jgi:hypothetical protein